MGNKAPQVDQKSFFEHQKLGQTRVFEVSQKSTEGEIQQVQKMQITRSLQTKDLYEKWQSSLKKINDSQGQQLFLIPQTHTFQKAGLCGNSGIAKLAFNKFEFVLSSEIMNRKNLKKYFEETEIWAGNKFQILKEKIGDIHPNNILINEDGQTAIISQLSIPGEVDNFQKYLQDKKAEVFLAPQQIHQDDIEKGVYNQKVDKNLAETFSLGVTLLSAGTLEHCNDIYLREPLRINNQRLNELINQFSRRYSPFLTQTLKSMLEINPQVRQRSKNIYQNLLKYENQILDLQPFGHQYQQNYANYRPNSPPNPNGYYNQAYGYGNQATGQIVKSGTVYQNSVNAHNFSPNVKINNHNVPIQAHRF